MVPENPALPSAQFLPGRLAAATKDQPADLTGRTDLRAWLLAEIRSSSRDDCVEQANYWYDI
jgi:hypothetical protein